MLAQLQERSDVEAAGVDRRGELIRLRLRPGGSVDAVRSALEELGFASETVALAAAQRWYGPSDVRELSRDEAEVVASRVSGAVASAHGIGPDLMALAAPLAAAALYGWFVERSAGPSSGGERGSCGGSVEAATAGVLGVALARTLGDAIEADVTGALPG